MSSPYAFTINGAVFFDPFPKQLEILRDTHRNLFVVGSRFGGKSYCVRMLCHALALQFPGFKYMILRRAYPDLLKNHLMYLSGEMTQLGGSYHKGEHVCYYPVKPGQPQSIGLYAQCATPEDADKLIGAEVCVAVFDEAPTLAWDHMRSIAASVRAPIGFPYRPRSIYLGNPIGESIDQLWSYFVDKDVTFEDDPEYAPEDFHAIRMDMGDNPHADVDEYRKQFAGVPAWKRKAWLDGEKSDVGTLFDFTPTKNGKPWHVIDDLPYLEQGRSILQETWVRVFRSLDWGFYPDPAVCLWHAVIGRRVITFKEKIWYRTIAKDVATDILRETERLIGKNKRVVASYCDPSMDIKTGADVLSMKEQMESAGLPLDNSINDREMFATALNSALTEEIDGLPRWQILRSGCPTLIRALPKMKGKRSDPGALADHNDDHSPVAAAYFLMSTSADRETAPRKPKKEVPWWKLAMRPERPVLGSESVRPR